MHQKFLELSKEKQLRIINAGMEIFGKFGYKKGNTDDIAAKAGISKGALFYYFHDKKSFFLYLFSFCEEIMKKFIDYDEIKDIDDFFDLLDYGSTKKIDLIRQYPYILNFILKAYYSSKEPFSKETNQMIQDIIEHTFDDYFQFVNFNKFKDGIDPHYIYHMLIWMGDGYLMEKIRMGKELDIDEMIADFHQWEDMFKVLAYKEEYL